MQLPAKALLYKKMSIHIQGKRNVGYIPSLPRTFVISAPFANIHIFADLNISFTFSHVGIPFQCSQKTCQWKQRIRLLIMYGFLFISKKENMEILFQVYEAVFKTSSLLTYLNDAAKIPLGR